MAFVRKMETTVVGGPFRKVIIAKLCYTCGSSQTNSAAWALVFVGSAHTAPHRPAASRPWYSTNIPQGKVDTIIDHKLDNRQNTSRKQTFYLV